MREFHQNAKIRASRKDENAEPILLVRWGAGLLGKVFVVPDDRKARAWLIIECDEVNLRVLLLNSIKGKK